MNIEHTKLSQFFPSIRARELILSEIDSNPVLLNIFNSWEEDQREEFLSICTGNKGAKMLYDSFFKEILNAEYYPERLSSLLSQIIGKKVTVKTVLPNDNTRLGDESSLVITDIVVELEDGTIANVEVQKLGYAFTGERSSCYSADLLLRQYKRVKGLKKKKFTYKDVAPVYTIVFLESSPSDFKHFSDNYIHKFKVTSDTGLQLNMLQNFIFIPVDIFIKKLHNEGIQSELEAWLTFLGCDDPDYIANLIQEYPQFKPLYEDLYDLCLNTERVMDMFSKELQILDRNTVKYMIDELQEELDTTISELDAAKSQLDTTKSELDNTKSELDNTKSELDIANETISDKDAQIAMLQSQLEEYAKKARKN